MIRGFISPTYAASTSRRPVGPSARGRTETCGWTTVTRNLWLDGRTLAGRRWV